MTIYRSRAQSTIVDRAGPATRVVHRAAVFPSQADRTTLQVHHRTSLGLPPSLEEQLKSKELQKKERFSYEKRCK